MDFPTKVYPLPPKPEWFMKSTTGLHQVGTNMAPPNSPVGASIASSFTKMDEGAYQQYLSAHTAWYDMCFSALPRHLSNGMQHDSIQVAEHKRALARRYLDNKKEAVAAPMNPAATINVQIPGYTAGSAVGNVQFGQEAKTPHPPTVSTQPHQAEKRANKNLARDAQTKAKAARYAAKAQVINESQTVPKIAERIEAVQKVASLAPLHKVELAAAKSAAARSKAVSFGSTDLVSNVKVEDWSVVTRKKGAQDAIVQDSYTIETNHDGVPDHGQAWTCWQTSRDPAFDAIRKNVSINPRPRSQVVAKA